MSNNLGELARDWEDYEEPKKFWFVDADGGVLPDDGISDETLSDMKHIGNLFNSKEEAEQAVEKLKAWRRLRDSGFRFIGCNHDDTGSAFFEIGKYYNNKWHDMHLLFGGKDE